jgi:hypothetical protein
MTHNGTFGSLCIGTFSGETPAFDDEDGGAVAGATNISPATGITVGAANSLVVSSLAAYGDPGTITNPSGYTTVAVGPYGAANVACNLAYKLSSGSEDPDWTTSSSTNLATIVASVVP